MSTTRETRGGRRRRALRATLAVASAGALGVAGSVLVTTSVASPALAATKHSKFVVEGKKIPKVGTVLESQARPVYALENHATCSTTSCIAIWHPVILPTGVKRASGEKGVKESRLRSATSSQGRQVTYFGNRLYWFTGDTSPTTLNGNGVTDTWGTWAAVKTNGALVGSAKPKPVPPTSGSGGYGY